MKVFKLVAILFFVCLIGACSGQNENAPSLRGNPVILEDSLGNHIPTPYSGIHVTVSGTDIAFNTDAQGNWQIQSFPPGDHDVIFTKDGFRATSLKANVPVGMSYSPDFLPVLTQAPDSIVHLEWAIYWDANITNPTVTDLEVMVTATSPCVYFFIDSLPNIPPGGEHAIVPIKIWPGNGNQWDGDYFNGGSYAIKGTFYVSACAGSDSTQIIDRGNGYALIHCGPRSNVMRVVIK